MENIASDASLYISYESLEYTEIVIPSELEREVAKELEEEPEPEPVRKPGKGTTGFWDKYGGRRMSPYQQPLSTTWYCQSCNIPQPKDLKPYNYEFPKYEYIRVCAVCVTTDCATLRKRVAGQPDL